MARPSKYSAEFRSDAIALWRASADRRTFKDVDADRSPATAGARHDTEAGLVRLRAESTRLARAEKEWQLEREILRRAAAYFARELK
jgi:transposase